MALQESSQHKLKTRWRSCNVTQSLIKSVNILSPWSSQQVFTLSNVNTSANDIISFCKKWWDFMTSKIKEITFNETRYRVHYAIMARGSKYCDSYDSFTWIYRRHFFCTYAPTTGDELDVPTPTMFYHSLMRLKVWSLTKDMLNVRTLACRNL